MCAGNGSDDFKIMVMVRAEVFRGLDFAVCAISEIVKDYSCKLHCCETHFSEKTPKALSKRLIRLALSWTMTVTVQGMKSLQKCLKGSPG